jgi:hypothetical protein
LEEAQNPSGWQQALPSAAHMDILRSHFVAVGFSTMINDVDNKLSQLASENTCVLFSKDCNGWQAIHEAAHGGHVKVLHFRVVPTSMHTHMRVWE